MMPHAKKIKPGVSIVIPHYGKPELASALVQQLSKQSYKGEIEIIVVDDCSPIPYPASRLCKVIKRETNGGF